MAIASAVPSGVGLKNADNGAILFVAPNEGKGQRGPVWKSGAGWSRS